MSDQNRRKTDFIDIGDIEQLIAEEKDPRARLHLLILHKFNIALSNNIEATTEVMKKFESHVEEYNAAKNQGQGAAKVFNRIFLPMIAILQTVAIYFWSDIHDTIKTLQSSVITISTEQARRSVVLEQVQNYMKEHK